MITKSGIYSITNTVTSYVYVGSATNISTRWSKHRADLRKGSHHTAFLQRSWNKHGEESFCFAVLELVEDKTLLIERENYWIAQFPLLYNARKDAANNLGVTHSEETKELLRRFATTPERIEIARRTALNRKWTIEERHASGNGRRGKPMPSEAVEIIRQKNTGKKLPPRTETHMKRIVEALSQDWIVTNPEGVEIKVRNLKAFCLENGLSQGHMSAIARGERRIHKGWVCRKVSNHVEEDDEALADEAEEAGLHRVLAYSD